MAKNTPEIQTFFSPSDISAEADRGQQIRNNPASLMPVSVPALPAWGAPAAPDYRDRLLSAFAGLGSGQGAVDEASRTGSPLAALLAGFAGAARGVAANTPEDIAARRAEAIRQAQLAQLSTIPVEQISPDVVAAHPELKGLPLGVINQIAPVIEKAQAFNDSHFNLDQAASQISPTQNASDLAATRAKLQKLYPNGIVPRDFVTTQATNNRFTQGQSLKLSQQDEKRLQAMGDALDPSKQRAGAFGVSKQVFDRAERLQSLAQAYKDGNLDARQMEELAIGLNSLLSGSNTGSQEQVKGLIPKTLIGNASKMAEWLTNNPTGTNQQAFVARMLGSVEREKNTAADQIKRTQMQRIAARFSDLEKKSPDDFYNALQAYEIDPKEWQAWKTGGFKALSAVQAPEGGSNGSSADLQSAAMAELKRRGL